MLPRLASTISLPQPPQGLHLQACAWLTALELSSCFSLLSITCLCFCKPALSLCMSGPLSSQGRCNSPTPMLPAAYLGTSGLIISFPEDPSTIELPFPTPTSPLSVPKTELSLQRDTFIPGQIRSSAWHLFPPLSLIKLNWFKVMGLVSSIFHRYFSLGLLLIFFFTVVCVCVWLKANLGYCFQVLSLLFEGTISWGSLIRLAGQPTSDWPVSGPLTQELELAFTYILWTELRSLFLLSPQLYSFYQTKTIVCLLKKEIHTFSHVEFFPSILILCAQIIFCLHILYAYSALGKQKRLRGSL